MLLHEVGCATRTAVEHLSINKEINAVQLHAFLLSRSLPGGTTPWIHPEWIFLKKFFIDHAAICIGYAVCYCIFLCNL